MPIDFPGTPSDGDSYSASGKTWVYSGTASAWTLFGLPSAIANGAVGTGQLATDAVHTAKIANGAVTIAKLHSSVMSSIDNLGDVNLAVAPSDGHFLVYSASSSAWISASAASGGGLNTDSDGAISTMDIGA